MTSPTTAAADTSTVLGQQPATDAPAAAGPAAISSVLGQQPAATATDGGPDVAGEPSAPAVGEPVAETVGVFFGEDGREHYASPYSKGTRDKLAAGTWSKTRPEPAELFDPSKVHVDEVFAYLAEHADDADEVTRVKAAEAEGKKRVTVRDWTPEQ